jgi:C-terminal processing protease CtpA/Prc
VAYLAYNEFVIEADMASWTERGDRFLAEMREAFVSFKADGATEMVLDLRYNHGGYVKACQVLTRLISGAGRNEVFAKMLHNNNSAEWAAYGIRTNPEVWNFSDEASDADALGLRKLYVLATEQSASASEMVINALRGIDVEVVVIGETTNGKNVGMNRFEFTDASGTYHMWPITFKVLNAKGFCDYAGGFTPDFEINDLAGVSDRRPLFSLGDGQEELLRAALTHIDGGQPAARTRSASSELRQLPVPASTRGGARIVHAGPTPAPSTNR